MSLFVIKLFDARPTQQNVASHGDSFCVTDDHAVKDSLDFPVDIGLRPWILRLQLRAIYRVPLKYLQNRLGDLLDMCEYFCTKLGWLVDQIRPN